MIATETMKIAKYNGGMFERKEIIESKKKATKLICIPGTRPVKVPIITPKNIAPKKRDISRNIYFSLAQ